jgi:hypothetical protein
VIARAMLCLATLVAYVIGAPGAASPTQPCEVAPMPCTFEARPFTIRVLDAVTSKPLPDVHVLAEWQLHGVGGRLNGPLMVLDAVSGADGAVTFPGWGPLEGSLLGLGVGRDPILTLFKSGYVPLIVNNPLVAPGREYERVRRFGQNGTSFVLQRSIAGPDRRLEELETVWLGVALPRNDDDARRFRVPYLNRLKRIAAERSRFPLQQRRFEGFFWHVDRELRFMGEGRR